MNAQIANWLEWLKFYTDKSAKGLTEFETVKLDVSDLTAEELKDIAINYDFKLLHTTSQTGCDCYETNSAIVYEVMREESEHVEYKENCRNSYLYWANKLNEVLTKEPEYKEEVISYLECYNLYYPELDLGRINKY